MFQSSQVGRASISLTLLLVCASYFQFSSSLVPRLGYLTILDKHSLWCIFLVIVMVFWVGIIKMVRHHTVAESQLLYAFLVTIKLSEVTKTHNQSWLLLAGKLLFFSNQMVVQYLTLSSLSANTMNSIIQTIKLSVVHSHFSRILLF